MALPREMYGDPERWLILRGEDCTHCESLGKWRVGGELVTACGNTQAPTKKREQAPQSRCHLWRHEKQDGGQ